MAVVSPPARVRAAAAVAVMSAL
ncbi:MAG: hypothetical protein JWP48_1248, partial [Actinoallomurus sp.]|nr:hypothetical protein [Actinoallomurus sp.]